MINTINNNDETDNAGTSNGPTLNLNGNFNEIDTRHTPGREGGIGVGEADKLYNKNSEVTIHGKKINLNQFIEFMRNR